MLYLYLMVLSLIILSIFGFKLMRSEGYGMLGACLLAVVLVIALGSLKIWYFQDKPKHLKPDTYFKAQDSIIVNSMTTDSIVYDLSECDYETMNHYGNCIKCGNNADY